MATTIHEPPSNSHSGDNGWGNLPPASRRLSVEDNSPASRTGIWVGLAAITMTFAAFTSALVVRQASSNDWVRFSLPPVLYANTVLLLVSSMTLEIARRKFARFTRHPSERRAAAPLFWLYVTLGLGLMFVIGQYMAWRQLKAAGLYLATTPSASFFYVLTAAHVLHVLGGLAGLLLVISRLRARVPTLRGSTLNAVSYYWHFMDILWFYLLALLWLKL